MNRLEYLLVSAIALALLFLSQTAFAPVLKNEAIKTPSISSDEVLEEESVIFLGDIMLGRYVEKKMEALGDMYPFEGMYALLASSTYVIANLEGPIPEIHSPTPMHTFRFSFKPEIAQLLARTNIKAVSLANNHGMDWGSVGYLHTKATLDKAKVKAFGNPEFAVGDVYEESIDGVSVAVFGVNMIVEKWNEAQVLQVVQSVRKTYPQSHLVAFLHWGDEYSHKQNFQQERFAHSLIDSGVDTVIGAHPHVVQGIEKYKNKVIFYSMGNFIFDQYFSQDVQDGYLIKLKFTNLEPVYEIIPYVSVESQPKVTDKKDRDRILSVIATYSDHALEVSILNGIIMLAN